MHELSLLVPCLNEADSLPRLFERLERVCVAADLDVETIVLDDASDDDTLGVAQSLRARHRPLNIRVVHRFEPRRGLGALIRYGMAHAVGRYALIVAADGTHPIEDLPRYLATARGGAQLVQCSRFERLGDGDNVPRRIRVFQRLYGVLSRLLLGWDPRDATNSFKLVDRTFILALGMRSSALSIVPEIPLKAHLAGGKIAFVPGRQSFRERGISHIGFFRGVAAYACVLLRAWLHKIGVLAWF